MRLPHNWRLREAARRCVRGVHLKWRKRRERPLRRPRALEREGELLLTEAAIEGLKTKPDLVPLTFDQGVEGEEIWALPLP